MDLMAPIEADAPADLALEVSQRLKSAVRSHLLQAFAPDHTKTMRLFTAPEAAELLNTSPPFLRKCHNDSTLPNTANNRGGRRLYTAEELWEYRQILEAKASVLRLT